VNAHALPESDTITVGLVIHPDCLADRGWTPAESLAILARHAGLRPDPDGQLMLLVTCEAGTQSVARMRTAINAVRRVDGRVLRVQELPPDAPGGPRRRFAAALTRLIQGAGETVAPLP
jgi:hypothetical protein